MKAYNNQSTKPNKFYNKKIGFLIKWLVPCFIISFLILVQNSQTGHPATNIFQVEPWLFRGERPRQEDFKELAGLGVKTIINLERTWINREPDAVKLERSLAVKNNIQFKHIPMHPFLGPKKSEVQEALAIIQDPANHSVFVHCRRGRDRTGIVIAAFRIKCQGWTAERAYEEMKGYGHRHLLLFWWRDLLFHSGPAPKYFEGPLRIICLKKLRAGDLSNPALR